MSLLDLLGRLVAAPESHRHHPDCCGVCGGGLGSAHMVTERGERFCRRHDLARCSCFTCGVLTLERLGGPPFGFCGPCLGTAINGQEQADTLLREIQTLMRHRGLSWWPQVFPVELCAGRDLAPAHGDPERTFTLGNLVSEIDPGSSRRNPKFIRLLRGLPTLQAGTVLAHELGHAWLAQHGLQGATPLQEEGFCEWCAAQLLQTRTEPAASHQLRRMANWDNPVYGEGYRLAARVFQQGGLNALLAWVQRPEAGAEATGPVGAGRDWWVSTQGRSRN